MQGSSAGDALLPSLVVCITFHYDASRIVYLNQVIRGYAGLAERTRIHVVTNAAEYGPIERALEGLAGDLSVEFFTPTGLGHPYLLAWSHYDILRDVIRADDSTHFLYSEDDISLTRTNVAYWLRAREALREHGLLPSFYRVERNPAGQWVSTENCDPVGFSQQSWLFLEGNGLFMTMPNPHQGMYFLDQPLMQELISSPDLSPDKSIGGIREKAALGLTFIARPKGFNSRTVVPVDLHRKTVDQDAWVHHLPNSYSLNPESDHGKILMDALFEPLDDAWAIGGLYSMHFDEKSFMIVKVLVLDALGVHVRKFSPTFSSRPAEISPSLMNEELRGESDGIEFVPFSRSLFAILDAQYIQHSSIIPWELEAYERWKAGGLDYFG
ncbi:hypothetical protein H6G65_12820 [Microcystis elabens FACHB-917]|nr:hypothetical protein [Microcystis elabens FACHB-917]